MSESQTTEKYSFLEEIFNSITHGIGALISIAGLVLLIVFSIMYGNLNHIISCTIFGFTLVLLYTVSTLYHIFQKSGSCVSLFNNNTFILFLQIFYLSKTDHFLQSVSP